MKEESGELSMNYKMEELVPIVGRLADKYTSFESTSITYEKAEQLMGAVLYCIHEAEICAQNATACNRSTTVRGQTMMTSGERMPAEKMYEIGVACVEKKVRDALALYHGLLSDFMHYDNHCLYDTVIKGLPEFFKWYDVKYEPQNTILALDYPVLTDLSGYTGVDKIYEYIVCIGLEQRFLSVFPENYVAAVLSRYSKDYKDIIENLCEIVLADMVAHILIRKPISEMDFKEDEHEEMKHVLLQFDLKTIKQLLQNEIGLFLKRIYAEPDALLAYLSSAINDTAVRLMTVAEGRMV